MADRPVQRGKPLSIEIEIRFKYADGVTEARSWSCSGLNWNETPEQIVVNGTKLGVIPVKVEEAQPTQELVVIPDKKVDGNN